MLSATHRASSFFPTATTRRPLLASAPSPRTTYRAPAQPTAFAVAASRSCDVQSRVLRFNPDIAAAAQADVACLKTDSLCHRYDAPTAYLFSFRINMIFLLSNAPRARLFRRDLPLARTFDQVCSFTRNHLLFIRDGILDAVQGADEG